MTGLMFDAAKYAWSRMPAAAALVGEATPDEIAAWCDNATRLAELRGVAEPYTELAGELLALGEPPVLARVVALWAALRYFGADEQAQAELDGPTDAEIYGQRLAFEADREEAETRRFYREDFPGVAAARGQRVEESPAWRIYGVDMGTGPSVVASTFRVERAFALHELPRLHQVDWSADRIRDEYRRWWTTAERRFWDAEYAAAKPHAADDLEAARFATRRVLDRRIEAGARRPAAAARRPAAAAADGVSA